MRLDAEHKVTGAARFTADLPVPEAIAARVVRSPYPHARVVRVDVSRAAALPGVVAVLTRDDLPPAPYFGVAYRDQPIVATDRVRFVGEPVSAVAAVDTPTADAACQLIDVEYRPLPDLPTVEAAIAPGAPVLHETLEPSGLFGDLGNLSPVPQTNICHHAQFVQGDVEQGLAEADLVFEDRFLVPAVAPLPLEPHAVVAHWMGDGVVVWSSTQHPFPVAQDLARLFGLPLSRVRVIAPPVGGGFGMKAYSKLEPLAVALARKAGRPVRLILDGEEVFQLLTRHAAVCTVKVGVRRDGTLVARRYTVYLDTGAYADTGPRVANKVALRALGPYRTPHARVDVYCVYTTKVPAGSMRGFGGPQVAWATERQMDLVAHRLGLDPLEVRRRNVVRRGEVVRPGKPPMDCEPLEMLERAADLIGWGKPLPRGRGRGLAFGFKDGGGSRTVSTAVVRLHADGSATVSSGSVEIGQGASTILRQIVSLELGVPLQQVTLSPPDTAAVPYDQATSMSRTTVSMGLAVLEAARDVLAQVREFAAEWWGVPVETVEAGGGEVRAGARRATYAEVVAGAFGMPAGEVIGRGYVRTRPGEHDRSFWEMGVGAAEVEVDPETGAVRVVRYVSVVDAGKAINRDLCEGQDEGAAVQGLGHALFEALRFEGGHLLNGSLLEYRVPLAEDVPEEFRSEVVEHGGGPGPYGAKGVAEGGIVAVAPAVGNAVQAATGVAVTELPLTPENLWRMMRARAAQTRHGTVEAPPRPQWCG
ncbi:MAG: xanthine dehydrogenase family protein molybdopterin-binding subunit [Armatimonadota bacterium]|nr:xanthine dehydrogenase family protein molybdopterin-binding subunit [Armatimonadota bacterium]MDR7549455.1 xanthine dehydrogenase family protein molybdopterin-binding subunit [Armatimonadota bacterium]